MCGCQCQFNIDFSYIWVVVFNWILCYFGWIWIFSFFLLQFEYVMEQIHVQPRVGEFKPYIISMIFDWPHNQIIAFASSLLIYFYSFIQKSIKLRKWYRKWRRMWDPFQSNLNLCFPNAEHGNQQHYLNSWKEWMKWEEKIK